MARRRGGTQGKSSGPEKQMMGRAEGISRLSEERTTMARARVIITLKRTIMDAQGQTIERALHNLGYGGVSNLRMGKIVEMDVDQAAAGQVDEMCRRLLANPIIEDFRIEVEG